MQFSETHRGRKGTKKGRNPLLFRIRPGLLLSVMLLLLVILLVILLVLVITVFVLPGGCAFTLLARRNRMCHSRHRCYSHHRHHKSDCHKKYKYTLQCFTSFLSHCFRLRRCTIAENVIPVKDTSYLFCLHLLPIWKVLCKSLLMLLIHNSLCQSAPLLLRERGNIKQPLLQGSMVRQRARRLVGGVAGRGCIS
jgi:hypothetical protein